MMIDVCPLQITWLDFYGGLLYENPFSVPEVIDCWQTIPVYENKYSVYRSQSRVTSIKDIVKISEAV